MMWYINKTLYSNKHHIHLLCNLSDNRDVNSRFFQEMTDCSVGSKTEQS